MTLCKSRTVINKAKHALSDELLILVCAVLELQLQIERELKKIASKDSK